MKYTSEVIQQICNRINLVDYVSQYIRLEERKGEYWACCPIHKTDDTPSFSIKDNKYYCFGCSSKGNIINFFMAYHKKSFPEAMETLIKIANIDITEFKCSNVVEFLRKISKKKSDNSEISRNYLPDNIMNQYTKEPIKEWLSEGISQEVIDKYEVRYDKLGNRIVFPIHDTEGRIIAVKGRTLYHNYKDLGMPKYIYYQSIGSNDFLGGLYHNKQNIKENNEVIVVEGIKGVFLAESYGYSNVVSLETNHINQYQLQLLLSLRVPITFALDKGVQIDSKIVGLLPKFTDVFYVEDKDGLIKLKDCPFDHGKTIWEKLYNAKIKYER